jgi:hypothetical protein
VVLLLLHSVEETGLWSCCCCILLRKQVCGLAEHVYAKSHWLKEPSPVSCPIGGRSVEIEGNPSLYIL